MKYLKRVPTHWKVYVSALIIFLIVGFCGRYMYMQSDHLRVKVSRDATLVQAYEYDDRCGHKGRYNCSAYNGRFLVEPEHVYITKPIDGFFYHRYIDKGKVDMPAYVSVSKMELGAKLPPYTALWFFSMSGGFVCAVLLFFIGGFVCLLADQDERDRRRYGYRY
jgi:hypothetical protein